MAAAEDSRVAIDVVVIAGDHLDIGSAVPLEAQAIAVSAQLRHLGARIPVLSASGNHDLDSRDSFGEKTARWLAQVSSPGVHVDGDSVLLGDTLFTICPWWDGPIARKSLTEQLRTDARRTKQRWVWIYHSPPTASPLSWNGRREFGDEALTEWLPIFRPDVVLAGHIHQAPFVDGGDWIQQIGPTWLFNAGQQPGPSAVPHRARPRHLCGGVGVRDRATPGNVPAPCRSGRMMNMSRTPYLRPQRFVMVSATCRARAACRENRAVGVGMMMGRLLRRAGVVSVGCLIATGLVGIPTAVAANQMMLVSEPFTAATTTSPNWVLPAASGSAAANDACLTGATSFPDSDSRDVRRGASGTVSGLQLTTNGFNQEGGLAYGLSVPTSEGLGCHVHDGSVRRGWRGRADVLPGGLRSHRSRVVADHPRPGRWCARLRGK